MAITPNDIMDRLEEMLSKTFPDETIYLERVETGFKRPCNLIIYDGGSVDVGFGSNIVEVRDQFTLTSFVEVNKYKNSHLRALHTRQMRMIGMFIPGYIKVKDRAPKVVKIERAGEYDYDTVTVTLSYTLSREDFMNIPQLPLMEELHTTEEVKTYG